MMMLLMMMMVMMMMTTMMMMMWAADLVSDDWARVVEHVDELIQTLTNVKRHTPHAARPTPHAHT